MELEDLPYRCPKCGDAQTFPSLRHLRQHLDKKHSYHSPWKRPVKDNIQKYYGRHSPLSDSFKKETQELENQLKLAKETEQKHKEERQQLKWSYVDINGNDSDVDKNKAFKKQRSFDKGVQSDYQDKNVQVSFIFS